MDKNIFSRGRLLAAGIGLFLLASCAGETTKGYRDRELAADQTATIEAGSYADIVRCDGAKLTGSQLNVVVLPGIHTVEMNFRRQLVGNRFLYSVSEPPEVAFMTEPGHRYVVNVDLVARSKWMGLVASEYEWNGSVVDKGTGQTIAATAERLPVRTDWIYPGIFNDRTSL